MTGGGGTFDWNWNKSGSQSVSQLVSIIMVVVGIQIFGGGIGGVERREKAKIQFINWSFGLAT